MPPYSALNELTADMSISPIILDIVMFYAFFRFCKWLLMPYFVRSPFHDIPGPLSESWFTGNLGQLFNAKGLPFHQELVDRFGGMVKVHGFFGDEQLYISDPRALQSIVVKDQDAFEETSVFLETNKVIFGPGLVATAGDQHKRQRKLVNPMFSVGQLRQLTPVIYDISDKLANVLEREADDRKSANGESILDMSEWMSRVALEIVGQTVLGYSFDPLDTPHNNPYTSAIKELIPTLFQLALVRQFAPFLVKLGPAWFRRQLVEWTPHRAVQKVKDMSDVMYATAKEILHQKRDAIQAERTASNSSSQKDRKEAKDVISVLLRANEKAGDGDQLSDLELTGQMTVLIFGAQDTTSGALSRILHMLACHPEVQDRVRAEVKEAFRKKRESDLMMAPGQGEDGLGGGRLTYDEIMTLPWLDAVMKETMRLYPPVPFVRRTTVKERTIPYTPLSESHSPLDQNMTTSAVTIPVGTTLFVSIAGSNRLESVWGPDAKLWKPERWMGGDMKAKDPHSRLPGVYAGTMSFFGGGRSCIGYKFAQVEMKIVLATLLSRFRFSTAEVDIVWNLSQIISPSVRKRKGGTSEAALQSEEKKGLPLIVRRLSE